MPSFNRMVVKSVAMEAYKAYHSRDGINRDRNPAGVAAFGHRTDTTDNNNARISHYRTMGMVLVPLRGTSTFATTVALVWNTLTALQRTSMRLRGQPFRKMEHQTLLYIFLLLLLIIDNTCISVHN